MTFLKWPGGKRQLLPALLPLVPADLRVYHEPFMGGGALFFALAAAGRIEEAQIGDANLRLVHTYRAVRDNLPAVVDHLRALAKAHDPTNPGALYYTVRAAFNGGRQEPAELAARMIYLNRTCFNGLYRENARGGMNTPVGAYKNPTICDEAALTAAASALQLATIDRHSFEVSVQLATRGDFVYLDPPYAPLSETSSFTAYSAGGFGPDRQRDLARTCLELHDRGVRWLLSNSTAPIVRELYGELATMREGITICEVPATRRINCKASSRGEVAELLVFNYPTPELVPPPSNGGAP